MLKLYTINLTCWSSCLNLDKSMLDFDSLNLTCLFFNHDIVKACSKYIYWFKHAYFFFLLKYIACQNCISSFQHDLLYQTTWFGACWITLSQFEHEFILFCIQKKHVQIWIFIFNMLLYENRIIHARRKATCLIAKYGQQKSHGIASELASMTFYCPTFLFISSKSLYNYLQYATKSFKVFSTPSLWLLS